MNKVDRALEIQVIDWLQWYEFPEKKVPDVNMPGLTLELIDKRKKENIALREQNAKLIEALVKIKNEAGANNGCAAGCGYTAEEALRSLNEN